MRKYSIALLASGLLMGGMGVASAQQMAAAVPPPKGELVVFTEKGSHELSATALSTIRTAASEARSARQVTLTGRPENAAAVKDELMRQGVPARTIVVLKDANSPLPKARDGLSDPLDRRVEISF